MNLKWKGGLRPSGCCRVAALPSLLTALLVASQSVQAQSVTTATKAKAQAEQEVDVLELTPFEVKTEKDNGFAATGAITGSKLAMDMNDVPVSYSVVNKEFIEALNITDLAQASAWTTNAHANLDGQGGGDYYYLPVLTISRGGGNQLRQRNFFLNFSTSDSYNIERFDFGRGPNAALFGNGTLGGNQVSMTKRPRYDRAIEEVSLGAGSYNRYRATVDVNTPLTSKASLRVNAVYDDRDGYRLNEMEQQKSVFISAGFKPAKRTEIRVDAEIGTLHRNIAWTTLTDKFSGWDGLVAFSGPWLDNQRANTATGALNSLGYRTTYNGDAEGVTRMGSSYFVWSPDGTSGAVMNYQNFAQTRAGGSTTRTPIGGYTYGNNATFATDGASILYAQNVPQNRFDNALARSKFRMPDKRFTMAQHGPTYRMPNKDLQLTVSQQIGSSWFVELAGDSNRQRPRGYRVADLNNTYIDVNKTLPDGSANTHFLEPYGEAYIQDGYATQIANAWRGAVAYVKDFGKWGHYSFNLMGGTNEKVIKNGTYTMSLKASADSRAWNNTDQIRVRQYWYSAERPTGTELAGKQITLTNVDFTSANAPIYSQTTVTPDWVLADGANEQRTTYNYLMLANTTKLLKGRLALMGAARWDDFSANQKIQAQRYQLPSTWDGRSIVWRPDAPADYATLTYKPYVNGVQSSVATAASSRPTTNNTYGVAEANPLYANDRFRSDYNPPSIKGDKISKTYGAVFHLTQNVSLFCSKGESYDTPTTGTLTILDTIAEPSTAKGWDAGVRLSLLRDRVSLKLTHYVNNDFGGVENSTVQSYINGLYACNYYTDSSTVGRNIRGASDIIGGRDIRDRESYGNEIELAVNLTRGLRISGNYGTVNISRTHYFPWSRQIVEQNRALYIQILQDAGGRIKTGVDPYANNAAEADPDITPANSTDRTNAVTNYNNINSYYNGLPGFNQKLLMRDAVTANVYADYTVQTGRLKGLHFGLGYQYRDYNILGYRGSDTIESTDSSGARVAIDDPNSDATTAVYIRQPSKMTATIGYELKLKSGKRVSFNLRIDNVLNRQAIIYQDASYAMRPLNGDYTSPARTIVPARIGTIQEPMTFFFTTTLRM